MIYKSIPEIEQIFLGSTAIGKIFNGSDLVFTKDKPSGDYIIFYDPDVKSIIVNEYGDTTIGEITYTQAAAVTTFMSGSDSSNRFNNNEYINKFDEFQYFTGITEIGNATFMGCSNLSHITIPPTVTTIGGQAFSGCSRLYPPDIPSSVTSIGDYAFKDCSNLQYFTIPNTVESIGYGAFRNSGLRNITISTSVTTIPNYAFADCAQLQTVNCPRITPPTLGQLAFNNTQNFNINVPRPSLNAYKTADVWRNFASKIYATDYIYFADPDVESIIVSKYGSGGKILGSTAAEVTTFMSGMNKTNNPFYQNTDVDSFEEFIYFTGITAIGNFTFYKCSNMKSVIIPANVTSIGTQAFQQCSGLTSLTIPASVTSLGDRCFQSCSALTSITCNATTPPTLGTSVFYSTNCPIYVPSASVDAYKAAWSTYASRIRAKS